MISLPQLCYDVAYFILPHYAFEDLSKVADMCANMPNAAGPFFYVMACQMRKIEPNLEDAPRLRWHTGTLDERRQFFVLEYPEPPPVDFSDVSPEELLNAETPPVLAPYFSGIFQDIKSGDVQYFILGQAPLGGGTTLRAIVPDGANCNLGPGPAPTLSAFLDVVRGRVRRRRWWKFWGAS